MIIEVIKLLCNVTDSVRDLRPSAVIHARIFEDEEELTVNKAALLIRVSTFQGLYKQNE